ncbi:MAG: 50S ribosomal protein L10 [Verrucomicrobia bacterium]|nr:50S ribosomal protein L10 [Verrucomicrobiota bacterium]
MRAEKKLISADYLARLNASPFFIVVDYTGLKVGAITELRKRLTKAGAGMTVVKNSLFKIAAQEAGVDLGGALTGQLAVVTGQKDIAAAAKALKTFKSEFEKPQIKFGYLANQRLEAPAILTLADLPPLEVLRAKFLGLVNTPATRLVQILNTPGSQLARVIKAQSEKPTEKPA